MIPQEPNSLTLSGMQSQVEDWIQSYGVRYFSELTNLAILMEEVGELSREMSMEFGEKSRKKAKEPIDKNLRLDPLEQDLDPKERIVREVGDILFVLSCLANQMNLSLEDCFQMAIQKNTIRDKDRHKANPKLELKIDKLL